MHIAVIVKGEVAIKRNDRPMGYFSYSVKEDAGFTWAFIAPGKRFVIDTKKLRAEGFDLIIHEDFGTPGTYVGDKIPMVYLDIDSTLSDYHYQTRRSIAAQAALILVDQAPLDAFSCVGTQQVYRFNYCVNDRAFTPGVPQEQRDLDVVLHQVKGDSWTRQLLRFAAPEACKGLGVSFLGGVVGMPQYAQDFGRAKVVLNWPRATTNRPHRVFDAMACGAAVLTGPLPDVSEDDRRPGEHYRVYQDWAGLTRQLHSLVLDGEWREVAAAGQRLVLERHTWAIRARQLRAILQEVGLWR